MLFIVALFCYRIVMKCIREPPSNMDLFIINDNITESNSITRQADSANQIRDESSLSLSLFAVSDESGSRIGRAISQTNTRYEVSSQLLSSYKESEISVFRESGGYKELRNKIVQPVLNEEMKLRALSYTKGTGEPLKLTFYSDTVKL